MKAPAPIALALLALATPVTLALGVPGCGLQREGERCSLQAEGDCGTGLACTPGALLGNQSSDICCPQDENGGLGISDNPACIPGGLGTGSTGSAASATSTSAGTGGNGGAGGNGAGGAGGNGGNGGPGGNGAGGHSLGIAFTGAAPSPMEAMIQKGSGGSGGTPLDPAGQAGSPGVSAEAQEFAAP